jgi:hypothetical protein
MTSSMIPGVVLGMTICLMGVFYVGTGKLDLCQARFDISESRKPHLHSVHFWHNFS